MNCRQALEKLYEYLDTELAESDREELEQHLENCSSCFRKYNIEKTVQAAIDSKLNKHYDVEPLKQRIRSSIDQMESGGKAGSKNIFFLLAPVAVAAVVALILFLPTGSTQGPAEVYAAVAPFATEHDKCLKHLLNPVIKSGDAHIVDSCMSALQQIPQQLFENQAPQVRLEGGLMSHLPEGDEPLLMYEAFGEQVSLFVNHHNSIDKTPFRLIESGGHQMYVGSCKMFAYVIWECQGIECIAVSKLPEESIVEFAASF